MERPIDYFMWKMFKNINEIQFLNILGILDLNLTVFYTLHTTKSIVLKAHQNNVSRKIRFCIVHLLFSSASVISKEFNHGSNVLFVWKSKPLYIFSYKFYQETLW